MGQAVCAVDNECLDLVITSAVVVDYTGIYKADIGIKDGKIAGIGKAGNSSIAGGGDFPAFFFWERISSITGFPGKRSVWNKSGSNLSYVKK